MWYYSYLGGVRLEGLHYTMSASTCDSNGMIDLQQAAQEGNVVGPLLLGRVPEGEGALVAGRIPSETLVLLIKRDLCDIAPGSWHGTRAARARW